MTQPPRIYLDNAATSWPKPEAVYTAVENCLRNVGASAGRGAYSSGVESQRIISNTRTACARLLGISDPKRLVFTSNGTEALNLVIHGLLRSGDHVVTTDCEHNSVLRPLRMQASRNQVRVSYAPCDQAGYVSAKSIADLIEADTRLVVVTHASNVTGAIQPIDQIVAVAHQQNVPVLIDAAQTVGCLPINVETSKIDFFACGGHKGLLGPLGTGLLYIRPDLEQDLLPLCQGGTGTDSLDDAQPKTLPEKYESGNLNVPAIAGLGAAVNFLEQRSIAEDHEQMQQLCSMILEHLESLPGIQVFGPERGQERVPVVSFQASGYDPQEIAMAWEAAGGIQVRAGLHCAPRLHQSLGTAQAGGLVRLSPGWSTTNEEITAGMQSLSALVSSL